MTSFDRLSIVVSVTDPAASGNDSVWLDALLREAATVDAELILAGPIADAASFQAAAREHAVELRILPAPSSSLTPRLWGLGLSASDRQIVAFTIDQCVVGTGWARAILDGFTHGDAGVGGTLALAEETSLTGRAIYFLRYSAFLGVRQRVRRQVRDIAGDNAAYRREALARYGPYDHGFWEIEAHHWLRADGATLALVPGMEASFGGAPSLFPLIRQRFAHGRHFGAWRARVGGRSPWKILLGAPVVPFVLLVRTTRRVAARPLALIKLATCAVPFLLLAAAWAAGEASGARTARVTESACA